MDRQYPIGGFGAPETFEENTVQGWIQTLETVPAVYRNLTENLSDEQLDTPYREGGWTVRQVVHHVADSHMQAYTRFKLALTEENPTIKPYDEQAWSLLADYQLEVAPSLALLEALHLRWVTLLRSLTPEQLQRTFKHPESGERPLWQVVGLYAWHSEHHLAHIRLALKLQEEL